VFINCKSEPREKTVCSLVERYYEKRMKVLVVAEDEEFARQIDRLLWTFSQSAFLPHEIHTPGKVPEDERIVIVTEEVDPGGAEVCVLTRPVDSDFLDRFSVLVDVAQVSPSNLEERRERYKKYKERGYRLQFKEV
jgi:DNA polymerase-3 subunit chi